MADFEERVVHGLRLRIDRTLCVGFGECLDEAPGAFALDGEDIAVFTSPETAEREALLRACAACPVDAICAWDESGAQLHP
ncbi:MAG: ferredoxin [Gemmatimonadaceae bacterium]